MYKKDLNFLRLKGLKEKEMNETNKLKRTR